jgi:hypothetical protein
MPRIIVTTDPSQRRDDAPVLLDERVDSLHLSSDLGAAHSSRGRPQGAAAGLSR